MFSPEEFDVFLNKLFDTVKEKLKYYRTYTAEVKAVSDMDMKGKIGLECLELLAKTPETYIWALPVGNPRMFGAPKIGDLVTLFFKDADPSEARFLSDAPAEIVSATSIQDIYTIIECATNGSSLKCDDKSGGFTIESKSQASGNIAVEAMVLGQKLKELIDYILDQYIKDIYIRLEKIDTDIANHLHISPVGQTSPTIAPEMVNRQKDKAEIGAKKSDIASKKSNYAQPGNLLSKVNKNN